MTKLLPKQPGPKTNRERLNPDLKKLGNDKVPELVKNYGGAQNDDERKQPGGDKVDHYYSRWANVMYILSLRIVSGEVKQRILPVGRDDRLFKQCQPAHSQRAYRSRIAPIRASSGQPEARFQDQLPEQFRDGSSPFQSRSGYLKARFVRR